MYKKRMVAVFIVYILLSLCFARVHTYAIEQNTSYLILYDNLYEYGKQTSDVFQLFFKLKSNQQDVRLIQIDQLNKNIIEKETQIIVMSSSFRSKEKYNDAIDDLNHLKLKYYDENSMVLNEPVGDEGLLIGINAVYPFSDLNKVMDISETLHDRGIKFVCTVMPVYENYEFEAFDKFIEVIKYVHKKGGQIFIHYPIINEAVTFDANPKPGLKKAIDEYRSRGIEIKGLTLSQNNVFMNWESIQDLNVQALIVTEPKTKVNINSDLIKASEEMEKYIIINGFDINSFNIFSYKSGNYLKRDLLYLTINDDVKKLDELLAYAYVEKKIAIKDYKIEAEAYIKSHNDLKPAKNKENELLDSDEKQLEKFREKEMAKIRGERLDKPQRNIQRYDLSRIASIAIKIALLIIVALIIQIIIGRRYDYKKFFKK